MDIFDISPTKEDRSDIFNDDITVIKSNIEFPVIE